MLQNAKNEKGKYLKAEIWQKKYKRKNEYTNSVIKYLLRNRYVY